MSEPFPKSNNGAIKLLGSIDSRVRLTVIGLVGGAAAGVLYLVQSAAHMTVQGAHDLYLIGAFLAIIGAGIGWLVGAMLRRPLHVTVASNSQDSFDPQS
jgi:hypothetical protein